MKVINFFGGPGVGKSTLAAGTFFELKKRGFTAELTGEFAKDLVYQRAYEVMRDQPYLFGQQEHRLHSLANYGVDFAVSDSPLPLSIVYNPVASEKFNEYVMEEFNKYNNTNFVIVRNNSYLDIDRRTTGLGECISRDEKTMRVLTKYNVSYKIIEPGDVSTVISEVLK